MISVNSNEVVIAKKKEIMKATGKFKGDKKYNYTLVKISAKEMKRRGMTAHKLSNCPHLIALDYVKAPYKKRDNSTWGHIFKGGYLFGVCEKVYKNQDAYIIIEQPKEVILKVERYVDFYGKMIGYVRQGERKIYKSIHAIASSNKALFGVKIGHSVI